MEKEVETNSSQNNTVKSPIYKKWWFIVGILLIIAVIVGIIVNSVNSKIDWSEIELGEYIPKPDKTNGEITTNTSSLAMIDIEKYTKELEDTLPKDVYYSVNTEECPWVLSSLLRNFKDIPENVELDIFGEIYEYFLGKFALAEGQGGGEFFTPSCVVKYMVEVLNPKEGKILDVEETGNNYKILRLLINNREELVPYHKDFVKIDSNKKEVIVKIL